MAGATLGARGRGPGKESRRLRRRAPGAGGAGLAPGVPARPLRLCWGEGVARCHLCPECSLPCDCAHKGAWGGGGGSISAFQSRPAAPAAPTASAPPPGRAPFHCRVSSASSRPSAAVEGQAEHTCLCVHICVHVCTCMYMCAHACACLFPWVCTSLCVRAHVHVHVCMAVSVVGECARVRTCVSAPSVLKTPLGVTRCGARPLCRGRRGCEEGLWLPVTLLRSRLGTRRCVAG